MATDYAHSGLIFFLAGLLLVLALAVTATAQPAAANAIERVLHEQQEAWNRHDLEAFMSGYWNSSELTFFSGATSASGWLATLERYRRTYQGEGKEMGKLAFSDLRIEPLGPDAAFVRGAWRVVMPDGKTPHGLFTLVFRRFPEGWKIVHDHTSAAE
jgi:beta-aspartyl-peptidase (threonine type)